MKVNTTKSNRKYLRSKLMSAFGCNCYWCGKPMEFPKYGSPVKDINKMATIEHYIGKIKGDINQILFLRLAHKECNK